MKRLYTVLFLLIFVSTLSYAQVEGSWVVAPEAAALAVGPELGDFSWWSNTDDDVNIRACFFDDQFVFNEDGTFQNIMGDETWLEAWQGVAQDECGVPVAPHDGTNAASWSYDEGAGTLSLEGVGAYLGLPKVINGAEISNPADAPGSISYPVTFEDDRMIIDINFGAGYWHFVLQKTTSDVQDIVENQMSISPNPAYDEIIVRFEQSVDRLIIRDVMGSMVQIINSPKTIEVIDISDFTSGLYLLESQFGTQRSIEKLIVK